MAKSYTVISADAHLETPPDLWTARMPKALRDKAPRVVKHPDGGDAWVLGSGSPIPLGLQVTGGQKYSEFIAKGRSFTDKLPGTGAPASRAREQDMDGTEAEVLFSSVVATALKQIKDPAVLAAITTAYNQWLSEYCSYAPERFFGMAVMPPTNLEDALAEAERAAKLPGIRGLALLTFPAGGDWGTKGDEPFWKFAAESSLCVVAHHNFGGEGEGKKAHPMPGTGDSEPLKLEGEVDLAMFAWLLTCDLPIPTLPIVTILQLILGGVLDRHPKLRFFFAESGIGWLPYWLEQMDDRFNRHRFWAKVKLAKAPSTYVREHVAFSFQEDHAGVALRHMIGLDNICWASDFPHSVGDWPWSRETRERQFAKLPADERRKIEALNIACHLGVITKAEKEAIAKEPRSEPAVAAQTRGARRM